MALKSLNELKAEIDQAVHTDGPLGKTKAPGLNAVLTRLAIELTTQQQEAALAITHKADLDTGGRVPRSQLPSYVDDIVEADSFAMLPYPGETGKVYVTLDTNKQYRWTGTTYALLSDSGLTGDVKAGLEAAAAPSSTNPFATLADIPATTEAKATLITAGRQRVPYFGTGTVSNTDEDGLKKALAAAQPGDTVQQLSRARIAAPYRTGEQIRIPAGVNYDTGGFDIDATGYCDGLILTGGTGVVHGGNATISHNVNGSWGIGWYGGGTLDYRIYDLNIHTTTDGREYFANPFSIYLHNSRVYHTGSIVSSGLLAIYCGNPLVGVGNQYEHVGTVTGLGNCALFGVNQNGRVIQQGHVVVTENATAGTIDTGARLTMQGGDLDLRNAQPGAGFKLDPTGTLELIDVTVLGTQLPALLVQDTQAAGATVHLYGATVIPSIAWPAGITVVDHRPVGTPTTGVRAPELIKFSSNVASTVGSQADSGTWFRFTSANSTQFQLLPEENSGTVVGCHFYIEQVGAGVVTITPLTVAGSNAPAPVVKPINCTLSTSGPGSVLHLMKWGSDTWIVMPHAGTGTASAPKTEAVQGDNLLDLTDRDVLTDTFINEGYIGYPTNVSGWKSSGFIPVIAGETYKANADITHSAWFDANKNFIDKYINTGIAPANAVYLRISVQSQVFPTLMVVWGTFIPATYKAFWKLLLTTGNKPLAGKKIGFVGDSLTLQGLYIPNLLTELGTTDYSQQGFSGEVFRSGIDQLPANAFADCSVIQVMFGTNEYGHGGNTLGTISDSSAANTICGVVRYAYEVLHAQYPSATIYFVTPTERGAFAEEPTSPTPNPYGLTIRLIGEAIKAVCRSLDIPFVDLYEQSNINSLTFAQTLQEDELHWSASGAAYVGKVIGRTLNNLLT